MYSIKSVINVLSLYDHLHLLCLLFPGHIAKMFYLKYYLNYKMLEIKLYIVKIL